MDERNNLSFKESRILHVTVSIIIVTFLFSALPEWYTPQFIMNSVVSSILVIIIVVSWRLVELKVRYFSIQSYCLVFSLSFLFAQPLIKYFWQEGNSIWFFLLGIWVAGFIITTLLKENIFQAFSKTFENRFSVAFHIVVFICITAGPMFIIIGTANDYNKNISYGSVLYLMSALLQITLPAFLKHPKAIMSKSI
ncbi:hypothetical protein ACQKFO_23225 [Rossellomorea sp. NPDC071047]|uniref:hypothetical protein n=1 Tax=Rossellomorea sp. NPDC071047 TaxID=3390675 RepID=UPI003D00AF0C